MKKKYLITILTIGMIASLVGCGSKETMDSTDIEYVETASVVNTPEDTDNTTKPEDEINVVEGPEYQYKEQKDIFVLEHIDDGDGTEIDMTDRVMDESKYTIPESIDIYSFFGTYAGYTKPNIYVGSVSKVGEWVSICFAQSSFLAKAEDFYRVAVAEEVETSKEFEKDVLSVSTSESNVQEVSKPIEPAPIEDTPAVVNNNKYTPDEAIAVYRGLMEAGGITWDPSLKGETSWGTGWIYLDKGQPEWCASTNLESFAMGDSGGNPWTEYYLEVTGSDESKVYITEWHN